MRWKMTKRIVIKAEDYKGTEILCKMSVWNAPEEERFQMHKDRLFPNYHIFQIE